MPDVIKVQRRLDELLSKLRITLLNERVFHLVRDERLLTHHIPIKNTLYQMDGLLLAIDFVS
jgi:hypothetical protein